MSMTSLVYLKEQNAQLKKKLAFHETHNLVSKTTLEDGSAITIHEDLESKDIAFLITYRELEMFSNHIPSDEYILNYYKNWKKNLKPEGVDEND
jgi:hypothetical protein